MTNKRILQVSNCLINKLAAKQWKSEKFQTLYTIVSRYKINTFNTRRQELPSLRTLIPPNYHVNGIISPIPECVGIHVFSLIDSTKFKPKTQHIKGVHHQKLNRERGEKRRLTSELALEYIISSALKTTIGSFICHSAFFLVTALCLSCTALIKQFVGIQKTETTKTLTKERRKSRT